MLPLRFSNSGIRAKVFVRKIGFKLRVMRLNRVESLYVFLLRFRSEGSEEGRPALMQGWLATARPRPRPPARGRPPVGVAARRGGACKHDRLWPAHKGGSRWQCDARKGLSPLGRVAASGQG
ncbi:hypothetical protein GW17_00052531 [Ensete ventricosum]|nr:hypothetical protein GW17_00052531 [Ensete ventricosum]